MRNTILLLLLVVWTSHLASALPVATLRVQFSSPPHSYSHGHDIHAGVSETTSSSSVLPYQVQQVHALSSPVDTQFLGYPRGRALEVAPLLQGDTQTIVAEDVEPTGPELDSLIARFANNAPRFFHEFPHQRALLNNIEIRMSQHLPDLRLGSIRPGSPFLRA